MTTVTMPMRTRMLPPTARVRRGSRAVVPVTIYGNRWCGVSQRIRRALDRAGIAYQYVDLDLHPDVERRLRMIAGPAFDTPVVYVDGDWLMAPTLRELDYVLESHGVG